MTMAGSLMVRQLGYENRAFWRNPAAAFFTFAFPLMFLVIFNLLFGNDKIELAGRSTTTSTFYVPAIAAFSVITACYTNLAMSLSFARDQGVLKRKLGTPLPPAEYLAAKVLLCVALAIFLVAITALAGTLFYGVDIDVAKVPAILATLIVGAAAFASLGFALTSFIPNADAAPAVVNGTILPLLFISDVFIQPGAPPEWLARVADFFPVKHLSHAMLGAFNPFTEASGVSGSDLLVVAVWGAAGALEIGRAHV